MIHVENLTIRFEETTAVSNFSYKFVEGRIYGLVGRNGAGKSSLLKGLTGLVTDFEGTVSFNNKDIISDRHGIKKMIGYTPEEAMLPTYLTGSEYLWLVAALRKILDASNQLKELLINFGLDKYDNIIIDEYSHGMQKKLSLAASLVGYPRYILIDEGLNGLDPQGLSYATNRLRELIQKQHTIIIASHDFELISDLCTHIIVLHEGRMIKEYSENDLIEFKKAGGKSLRHHFKELTENFPGQK
jgi:ABC-2 type transport system ATP-binding protein